MSKIRFESAREIANEQINYWIQHNITPDKAWQELGLAWGWSISWPEVRTQIIRYLTVGKFAGRFGN